MVLILSVFAVADLSADVATLSKDIVGTELPGAVGSLFGEENINIYIQQNSGSEFVIGLVTKDKKVASLAEGAVADPSLNVYTSEQTITEIQQAQDPGKALLQAVKDKKITYKGVGFGNKVKFAFTSLFAKVAGLFTTGNDDKVEKNETEERVEEKQEDKLEEKEQKQEQKEEEKQEQEKEQEKEEMKEETTPETEEKEETEEKPVETAKLYTVKLEANGFNPATLNIKKGDTVEWVIARSGSMNRGMILGTQACVNVKSGFFKEGESFKWKFEKAETCVIVDGFTTTQVSKVIVSE